MYFTSICLLYFFNMYGFVVNSIINNPSNFIKKFNSIRHLNLERNTNIILRKYHEQYLNNNITHFFNDYPDVDNASLITLTPGGLKGFYNLGTAVYVKENYNLTNYIYSGVSAGAWNGLLMTYKHNPHELAIQILDSIKENNKLKTVYDTQMYMKEQILTNYCDGMFELDKLYIGVTCIKNNKIFTNIYSDFNDLEDAIDCCIASSNIPFITGICEIEYNNYLSLDGGFSTNPYVNKKSVLEIAPDMWNKNVNFQTYIKKHNLHKIFFYNNNVNFYELYVKGYSDAKNNKDKLDYMLS